MPEAGTAWERKFGKTNGAKQNTKPSQGQEKSKANQNGGEGGTSKNGEGKATGNRKRSVFGSLDEQRCVALPRQVSCLSLLRNRATSGRGTRT